MIGRWLIPRSADRGLIEARQYVDKVLAQCGEFRDQLIAASLKLIVLPQPGHVAIQFRDQLIAASLKRVGSADYYKLFTEFRDQLIAASLKQAFLLPPFNHPQQFRDQLIAASLKQSVWSGIRFIRYNSAIS